MDYVHEKSDVFWTVTLSFPVCKAFSFDDVVEFLLWLGGMRVGRHKITMVLALTACWMCSCGCVYCPFVVLGYLRYGITCVLWHTKLWPITCRR